MHPIDESGSDSEAISTSSSCSSLSDFVTGLASENEKRNSIESAAAAAAAAAGAGSQQASLLSVAATRAAVQQTQCLQQERRNGGDGAALSQGGRPGVNGGRRRSSKSALLASGVDVANVYKPPRKLQVIRSKNIYGQVKQLFCVFSPDSRRDDSV